MNRFSLSKLTAGLLLAALAAGAQAADVSTVTDTVKGRAPEASNVVINNQSRPGIVPVVGDTVQADYSYADADGDALDVATFQWRRAGAAISGATSNTYTTTAQDVNRGLTVQVVPSTDPARTDPAMGTPAISLAMDVVGVPYYPKPSTTLYTWAQAKSHCVSRGATLLTVAQLKQLYLYSTSATQEGGAGANDEMVTVHGWPFRQGDPYNTYWALEEDSSSLGKVVYMQHGSQANSSKANLLPAACTK
ncbi:hypothetical protein CD175_27445 [Pseudomonas laurylsulfatiphila]|uniref:DUF1566 domain-containing protein n=1 Tax=Pseudomonas laurylsulfatiphila TaxID=2011015 RepID=A0A2S6FET3_9PSED|nr:C-type lectin domain-containing protein [Pseudomonas laurylsulfatiphila]PPK35926.1 hypothetical protein CD175_27445 [Pseudomonas laurylsulfatiphila]